MSVMSGARKMKMSSFWNKIVFSVVSFFTTNMADVKH